VPAVVRKCAVDLAVYNLFARKDQIPEARTQRHKDVVKVLEAVAAGKVTLGLPKPPDPPDDGDYEGGGRIAARPKIFSPDFMDRY
jgi:phage gp36-like protein